MRGRCPRDGSARTTRFRLGRPRRRAIGCFSRMRTRTTIRARLVGRLMDAVDHDAVLVSYSPEQEMETWWERALIPFVYCRLAAKFSFARVNDPTRPDAAANGQFLLVLRDAYDAVGGHAAVARRNTGRCGAGAAGESGTATEFILRRPMGVVRTRMYRSFAAMWQGWTKNLYPLMGGNIEVTAS